MSELRGTLLYMAPEIFCEGVYHPSCDLWSVGIIMYECLFGAPPYASSNLETLKMRLLNREAVQIPHNPQTSGNCSSLLKGLLRPDPSDRLNHQEFFDHPFVDLKHAPTAESLSHALSYLELAHECEQAGQLSAAYEKYTRGLAHLVSAIEYEPSPKQREELKQMASRYFDQAERVKSLLRSKSNTKFPPARPTCPPRRRVQAPCESADPHLQSKLVQQSSMATGPPHSTTCDTTSDEPKTATALPPSTWLSYVTSFLRRNPRTNSCTPVSAHSHPSPEVFPSAENPKVSLPSQSTQPLDQAIEESDDVTRCTDSTLPINSASILKDLHTTLCDGSRNSLDTVSSNEKISRLRALSVSFGSPDSQSECRPSSTEFDLTYLQHMAILTDTERLLELKSLCSSPDNRYGSILDSVEEFYLLLRTNRLHAAISHVEANFPNWLAVAKDDINEERRRAVMKELKLVLDLIEWSKQQSSEQLSSSENAGATEADCPVSHEVGIDALSEADSTDTSCCIS
ncbi:unnamed protein product [Dicrocoelium dendriticum]|nr:unnamed protein product [Dicrocoelium dendriticum]